MKKLINLLLAILPIFATSQSAFHNYGSAVYIQKGALVSVQGDFVNDNKGNEYGSVQNDGVIEVQGDFQNVSGAAFGVYNDNTSKDRAVKFVGSGTQNIIGSMNTKGTSSFYNLIVDKAASTDVVKMDADVTVEGSLVFGTSNTTTTYNPTSLYTDNEKKGFVQTYDSTGEHLVSVTNGDTDAIAGYPSLVTNGAPATGYVLTSGTRGSDNGGLQREVASAVSYDYPVGTSVHGFNAMRINFTTVPAGGGMVKGKFNDGTDNGNGSVGTIAQQCIGCSAQYSTPANNGFNQFFASNPWNNGAPQWVILQDAITDHGYWSFASADSNQNYKYSVEAFPNTFTAAGSQNDIWRTLQYKSGYSFNPSGAGVVWNTYVDSIAHTNDLLQYSLNTGAYTGNGVPGGSYSGFGQFALKKSNNSDALPVKMMYITATPDSQVINVNWATALEINNSGFNVERSTDGVNFSNIGFVTGHNNSTVQNDYLYTDNTVQANTVYYYRLNQVDNNGTGTLSDIVSAEVTGAAAIAISDPMPNPAVSASRIVLRSAVSMDINVKIYSVLGQLVSNMPMTVNPGDNTINLGLSALNSGSYNAVIEAGGKSFTKPFVLAR